jgi:predicted nucleotide-binding protein
MAKSRSQEPKSVQLTTEQIQAAIPKLELRIKNLEEFNIDSIQERSDPNADALAQKINFTIENIFGHGTVQCNEYTIYDFDTLPLVMGRARQYSPYDIQQGYKKGITRYLAKLKTLKESLEESLGDMEVVSPGNESKKQPHKTSTRRIFVVHGSDETAKITVARFLEKIDLQPVILHEEPNKGQTVIEKFEANTDVDFAIVLLTPDDDGYPKDHPEQKKPRARQNVVLELGYFIASLGRHRVCALYKGDVEIPSDISGVVYIPLDESGAWQLLLAREMKNAKVDIDLNKVV